jgi:hypothetical protein
MMTSLYGRPLFMAIVLLSLAVNRLSASPRLTWSPDKSRLTADIQSARLVPVLEEVAASTGWQVFVEPTAASHEVSAKFTNQGRGDALRLLLGDLNFALVPQTNGPSRLFVFRTDRQNATQLIAPAKGASAAKIIPNELIVRLKPGAKIEDLAKLVGAKVIGHIEGTNIYRLRFDDEAAASSAREQLAANSDVQSVENNYSIDRPSTPQEMGSAPIPPPKLQLKPPPDSGRVIVGLVDTGVQSLGSELDKFLLKQVSVAGTSELDPSSPSHGTSMAETLLRSLAAITKGSSSVQILPVDVYGANASTSTFDVANGVAQAVNGGAKIINLSLGSEGDSPMLHDIIQEASGKNIIFVSAAGNTPVTTPFYPAAYTEVLAVTAVDQGQIAPYANRGSFVSLGAPGTSVIYYNNQPYYVVGTSASAAFTSGLAAGYAETTGNSGDKVKTFLVINLGFKPAGSK